MKEGGRRKKGEGEMDSLRACRAGCPSGRIGGPRVCQSNSDYVTSPAPIPNSDPCSSRTGNKTSVWPSLLDMQDPLNTVCSFSLRWAVCHGNHRTYSNRESQAYLADKHGRRESCFR